MRISQLGPVLSQAWAAGRPVLILGKPGFGKTSVAKQTARAIWGYDGRRDPTYTFRIADRGIEEMKGLFLPDPEDRTRTIQTSPDWFPQFGDGIYHVLLDELVQAEPAKQAWARELALMRRINEENVLPPYVAMTATGNRLEDNASVHEMPRHFTSSIVIVTLEAHEPDWRKWALASGVHELVIGFVRFRTDLFDTFDPDSQEPYGCARSWHILSDVIQARDGSSEPLMERIDETKDEKERYALEARAALLRYVENQPRMGSQIEAELYEGIVGAANAQAFMAFLDVYRELPAPETCIARPSDAPVPTEPAVVWALATAIARKTTDENFRDALKYLDRLPPEYTVTAVDEAIERDNGLQWNRAYMEWIASNQDLWRT